jgi:hypothetical protein
MYLCILDRAGTIVLHQEVPAEPAAFLRAIAPFRNDVVVACEYLFCWYWQAHLWHAENIAFVLGHALLRKAIPRGQARLAFAGRPDAEGRSDLRQKPANLLDGQSGSISNGGIARIG